MKYQAAKMVAMVILIQLSILHGRYLLVDVNEKDIEDAESTSWTNARSRVAPSRGMNLQY